MKKWFWIIQLHSICARTCVCVCVCLHVAGLCICQTCIANDPSLHRNNGVSVRLSSRRCEIAAVCHHVPLMSPSSARGQANRRWQPIVSPNTFFTAQRRQRWRMSPSLLAALSKITCYYSGATGEGIRGNWGRVGVTVHKFNTGSQGRYRECKWF